jgi:hypothetical protein
LSSDRPYPGDGSAEPTPLGPQDPDRPAHVDQPGPWSQPQDGGFGSPPGGTPVVMDSQGGGGTGRSGTRGLIAVAAAVLLALILAGVGYAAYSSHSGDDPQPAEALPSTALAYLRVDLDPSAAQKLNGLQLLQKFPSFADATSISSDSTDLRKKLFELAQQRGGQCPAVDYDTDIAPWVGDRLGVAVLPPVGGDSTPSFAIALQVQDQDAAIKGFADVTGKCGGTVGSYGVSPVGSDYILFAKTGALATQYASQVESSSLADDSGFTADMKQLGDQGVVSMWLDYKKVAAAMPTGSLPEQFNLSTIVNGAGSVAAALRFDENYVELAAVTSGMDAPSSNGTNPVVNLPDTTFAALSVSGAAGAVDRGWSSLGDLLASQGESLDVVTKQVQQQTGLVLPDDLKTLLGDNFTLALDGDGLDLAKLASTPDPSQLRLGARVITDTAKFDAVFEKISSYVQANGGGTLPVTKVDNDGFVTISTNKDYANVLAADGNLGDDETFQNAVPDAGSAQTVFYVNFDGIESQVFDLLTAQDTSQEVIDNLKPLSSIGFSTHAVGSDSVEGVLRITVN